MALWLDASESQPKGRLFTIPNKPDSRAEVVYQLFKAGKRLQAVESLPAHGPVGASGRFQIQLLQVDKLLHMKTPRCWMQEPPYKTGIYGNFLVNCCKLKEWIGRAVSLKINVCSYNMRWQHL